MSKKTWWVRYRGNCENFELKADTREGAIAEIHKDVSGWGEYTPTKTTWENVHLVHCEGEPDEDADWDYVKITIGPPEPDCEDIDGHKWESPIEVVGGIKENPGVWGNGGGIRSQEVCMKCGCGRLTDTWAQDPETGEQGLVSVEYDIHYLDQVEWEHDQEEQE